jgi:hypothetical protein
MTAPDKPPGDVRWWDGADSWVRFRFLPPIYNGKIVSLEILGGDEAGQLALMAETQWLALPKDKPNVL